MGHILHSIAYIELIIIFISRLKKETLVRSLLAFILAVRSSHALVLSIPFVILFSFWPVY